MQIFIDCGTAGASEDGKKLIGFRTSAPAVPYSRSGKKNEYEMSVELVLPQSRTPSVEKNEYEMSV